MAIAIAVIVATLVTISVLYFISEQITLFRETYPRLKEKFGVSSTHLIQWFSQKYHSPPKWAHQSRISTRPVAF